MSMTVGNPIEDGFSDEHFQPKFLHIIVAELNQRLNRLVPLLARDRPLLLTMCCGRPY